MKLILQIFMFFLMIVMAGNGWSADKNKTKLPPPSSSTKYSSMPFDSSVENLPVNFAGNSIYEVMAVLGKNSHKIKKDEFETIEQYKIRMKEQSKTPLVGKVYYDSLLSFIPDIAFVSKKYDSETSEMTIDLFTGPVRSVDLNYDLQVVLSQEFRSLPGYHLDPLSIRISQMSIKEDDFIGQNAYGAKAKINRLNYTELAVAAMNDNKFIQGPNKFEPIVIKLSRDEAKEAKEFINVALIGKLESPYIGQGAHNIAATISAPREVNIKTTYVGMRLNSIWIYNFKTGKVYDKIPIVTWDEIKKE